MTASFTGEFAASNGYSLTITPEWGTVRNRANTVTHTLGKYTVDALKEYYLSGRDSGPRFEVHVQIVGTNATVPIHSFHPFTRHQHRRAQLTARMLNSLGYNASVKAFTK